MMLGKDRMAKLRSIAKVHNLAAGSQTVPNSVAEIAAILEAPPPSNLVRVVVSTNPHLLLQHRASQLPSKRP